MNNHTHLMENQPTVLYTSDNKSTKMEDDIFTAYAKLTQTPLAKTTTFFGLNAATWTVIVGILSIFLNVLPGIIFAVQISSAWDDRDEIDFFKEGPQTGKYASIAMLVICSLLQLVGAVLVIVGGLRRNPRFLYSWFVGFFCLLVFGRFVPGVILLTSHVRTLPVVIFVFAIVDVVVGGLMITSIIRLTGEFRNEKYLNMQRSRQFKVDPNPGETPVNVLPVGAYPRQP